MKKTSILMALAILAASMLLLTGNVMAAQWVVDDILHVLPDETPRVFPVDDDLLGNDSTSAPFITFSDPVHGILDYDPALRELTYTPNQDFWSLGTDSFTYTVLHHDIPVGTANVLLVAQVHGSETFYVDFEDGDLGGLQVPPGYFNQVFVDSLAAIEGNYGLQTLSNAYVFHRLIDGGKGDDSGSIKLDVRNPPFPDPFGLDYGATAEIVTVGPAGGAPLIKVLAQNVGGLEIGVEAPNTTPQWIPVEEGAHTILLDWWQPGTDGLLLTIDGVDTLLLENIGITGLSMTEYRIGTMVIGQGYSQAGMNFDNVLIRSGDGATTAHVARIVDGFEDGISSAWENSSHTNANATSAAALTGDAGLQVDLGRFPAAHLFYNNKSHTDRFRARFDFDPNSVALAGTEIIIFAGLGVTGVLKTDMVRVRLRLNNGTYQVRAEHNGFGNTGWVPIIDGPTTLGVQWKAASGSGSADGLLNLWVDGSIAAGMSGLANEAFAMRSAVLGLKQTYFISGSFFYDNFEAWKPFDSSVLQQVDESPVNPIPIHPGGR